MTTEEEKDRRAMVIEVVNAYNAGVILSKEPSLYAHTMLGVAVEMLRENYGPKHVSKLLQEMLDEIQASYN